ncbi:MAG: hypothetical protein ACP5EN_08795 [Rhodovulum sp.]
MRDTLRRFRAIFPLLLLPVAGWAEEVRLTREALVPVGPSLWAAPGVAAPEEDRTLPIVGARNTEDGARLLRHLAGRDAINGFAGILYDNRDRGHSTLAPDLFPRLARLAYGPGLVAENLDYGLAGRILLPGVVFGNSSTAITGGPAPRSQSRLAMTSARGPALSARLYARNAIYVYPEHRDHDAEDLFPANWPYTITSQGSSGSDRRLLRAIAMTLAAFRADTFAAMRDKGLVAPTLQMILRRNLAPVASREDYLSGLAHPPVFDPARVRIGRMVAQAADLAPDAIPPMVRLAVVEEGFRPAAGLAGLDERLFDTPGAIARIWRGFDWQREMVVSAEQTEDPNGRPLRFDWRLLAGDPARVRIVPLDPDGHRARIIVQWHDPVAVPAPEGGEDYDRRILSRVDIGVFAHNGAQDSAPAFVSISFPAHQLRRYGEVAGKMRLISVDYDARARGAYYDPVLHWSARWADRARRDAAGNLTGWNRTVSNGASAVVPPRAAEDPGYMMDRTDPKWPMLRAVPN